MKKRKNGIIVLVIILLVAALSAARSFVPFPSFDSGADGKTKTQEQNMRFIKKQKGYEGYIAALYITGVIQSENNDYNQKWLLDTIDFLKRDQENRGIAVFVDSPGGTVYEADEAYLALQDYKTSGKPVYVYQGSIAASGGYYISCAADKIYANRNTLTGSIGVITSSHYDLTGLYEKLGIKSETIHSGKNKNMLSENEPLTSEQRDIMQSVSDECYEQFTEIVAMSRNIPIVEVKKLADGRIYTPKQALGNGLIDAIDSWDGMISNMRNEKFEGKEIPTVDFKYERNQTFRDYIFGFFMDKGELNALSRIAAEYSLKYPAYLYR